MADWIDDTLIDPETHLVFDGIKAGSLVRAQYTYCQGAVVGLETELAVRTGDERHGERAHRLVAAISREMAPEGVLKGAGGGDGGLFAGVTARYLALAATSLPGDTPESVETRQTAARCRAQIGRGGMGQPADRRRPPAVRAVLGPRCRHARQRAGTEAQFVDGAVNSLASPRARPVGAGRRLDADGGRAFRGLGREELRRRVRDRIRCDRRATETQSRRHHRAADTTETTETGGTDSNG